MSAYPNLFEVLDDNGDYIAQEIDRKSKIIIKEVPASKKKEAPKKEEKKPDPNEKAIDGFEVKGQNRPPRQPRAEKASPAASQTSVRGGRGRGRGDRPPRAEGDQPPRRQDGESRPPRGDRPPRQEGEGYQRPPRGDRPPRQEGDQPFVRRPRQEGDRAPREDRPPRENRPYQQRNFEEAPQETVDENGERSTPDARGRGRGRGGRGGRGRGFYNNRGNSEGGHELAEGAPIEAEAQHYSNRPPRRPYREDVLSEDKGFVQAKQRAYDRRSATGRSGDDVKRSGRGANNWGDATESLEVYEEAAALEKAADNEAAPAEAEVPQAEEEAPAAPREVKKPEEDNTRTLKEYRETLDKELAQIELPPPRKAGEDSKDTWNNFKVLRNDKLNLKLSVVAPTKEKKKVETTATTAAAAPEAPKTDKKPKTRVTQVPVKDLLTFKSEPREGQDRPRRDGQDRPRREGGFQKERPAHHKQATPAKTAAAPEAPKIDKNSQDFPALTPAKN
jgi:hypothetical protein